MSARTAMPGSPGTYEFSSRKNVRTAVKQLSAGYDDSEEAENRYDCDTFAQLVSSERWDGLHAPTVDLDHRSVLTLRDGHLVLWVDAPLRPLALRRFLKKGARLRLTGELTREHLTPAARADRFDVDRYHALDTTERDWLLAQAGERLSDGEIETSFQVAARAVYGGPVPLRTAEKMVNPWPIPLAVDATLVPSTCNHHLYLHAALPWAAYRSWLKAARRARLVEAGFVKASIVRGASHLRVPWLAK